MSTSTEPLTRDQVREQNTWDLDGLYASSQAWEADLSSLDSQLKDYAAYQGTLGESAANLKACLEFDMNYSRILDKVYTFAHLRSDEDKTNALQQGNLEKSMTLLTRYQQARSFIMSEIMAIPEDTISSYLQDPELEFYRLYLERQLRYREHTLSTKEEALLAGASEIGRTPGNVFSMLDNADMTFDSIKDEDGSDITITHGNFMSLLQRQDRAVRKNAFETFYQSYDSHRHTLASLLGGSLKKDTFFTHARNFKTSRERALFGEDIPVSVYDNLIEAVHRKLSPLYRYFELRKRVLDLDELHTYDTHVSLVKDCQWNMPFEEAVDEITAALHPLGGEYGAIVRQGLLDDRWVDRYENSGKRSGAYSSGCYDSNPFILMNYVDDNINSVYTLAHEAGHSMHSHFSRTHQTYLYADYTVFVAEVASTFNEALLTRHLLSQDISKDMRIYLVCREIDNFRGTLIRQTMFAEFEYQIYAAAEAGQPLTADAFQELYHQLLERYFGPGVKLDPQLDLECFRIPHFYFGFYVYKYATGISAAYALAQRVLDGGAAEQEAYLNFLKSGGSKFPIDLLKDAGVDMSTPDPVETALDTFTGLVDQLETLLN
ncbi:MAG: oligoendopeptidase F [Candidatus Nitronauta litoralis]|uniref:Oligopeptidase F n=1 Tax=Candidatus Nitronauta litoralis TaxID=2705533 RepID=A0A7T0BVM8_9BACT|nr:MAG: oligoendopeptidase F [Candidatus Nitronauta litoralis]